MESSRRLMRSLVVLRELVGRIMYEPGLVGGLGRTTTRLHTVHQSAGRFSRSIRQSHKDNDRPPFMARDSGIIVYTWVIGPFNGRQDHADAYQSLHRSPQTP